MRVKKHRKEGITMKKIGFIGYGLRSETMMKAFTGAGLPLAPAAVADPRLETLQPQLARDGRFADTRYYADAEEMLDREALDAVFIGTRCGLHARYAALVMERGLPLFLEKPVCIDEAQYARLLAAPPAQRGRVMVSFPLHVTCIVQEMKRLVDSGALGDVVSVQAVNNVPYGGVYYHSWYRDAALTGGLFLQKSTHDIDYITHILGKRPVSVAALTSKIARTALDTAPARKAALLWNTAARKSPLASCAALPGTPETKMWARRCSPAKTARSFHTIRHFL